MNLTAENVDEVFRDCLFKDGEDMSSPVVAEGVRCVYGFHHDRLEGHSGDVADMLACLPDDFREDKGGGHTFLNACVDRAGVQWGEHRSIEQLMVLGVATGQVKILLPRDMWKVLPGGMPYFSVKVRDGGRKKG